MSVILALSYVKLFLENLKSRLERLTVENFDSSGSRNMTLWDESQRLAVPSPAWWDLTQMSLFSVLGYNHRNGISHKKRRVKVKAYDIFKMTHRQI